MSIDSARLECAAHIEAALYKWPLADRQLVYLIFKYINRWPTELKLMVGGSKCCTWSDDLIYGYGNKIYLYCKRNRILRVYQGGRQIITADWYDNASGQTLHIWTCRIPIHYRRQPVYCRLNFRKFKNRYKRATSFI